MREEWKIRVNILALGGYDLKSSYLSYNRTW
jgi:hypothetical protein